MTSALTSLAKICYCFLRSFQDLFSDGRKPHERPFGIPFNGPVIPSGAIVEHHLYFCERPIENTSIWSKSLARNISRLCIVRGRGRIWKEDILIADIQELEEMDASEFHARRLNAQEVLTPIKMKKLYAQSQMEQLKSQEEIDV